MSRSAFCSLTKTQAPENARAMPPRFSQSVRPSSAGWESLAQPHRCSCGGTCAKCSQEEQEESSALRELVPFRKSLESEEDDELTHLAGPHRAAGKGCALAEWMNPGPSHESDGRPHNGAATIVCDGAGGYGVQLNSWAGAKCGIEDCVRKHEQSHARDWAKRWPDGCKNADGTPKPAGSDIPLGGPGYDDFLKQSECDAYTTEVPCEEAALSGATKECKGYVQGVLDDTKKQQKKYCGGGC